MKPTGPSNYQLQELLREIEPKARVSRFWRRIAEDVRRSTRQRRAVNVYTIERYARDGETVVVPGKVLSVGELQKKVTVAAMGFSADARRKIEAVGSAISIRELLEKNPEGKKVRILG